MTTLLSPLLGVALAFAILVAPAAGLPRVSAAASGPQAGISVADFSDRKLELVSAAGFTWVKAWISWARLEPRRGQYAWLESEQNDLDNVLRRVEEHRLKLLVRIAEPPGWAGGSPRRVNPGHLRRFMQAMARHAGDRVGAYEIFNEPNLPQEWGGRADPKGYARLLRAAYQGVKAGNPRALVVSAGPATTGTNSGGVMDDLSFIRKLYQAGARGTFDALGSHPYGFKYSPRQSPSTWLAFRHVEQQRAMMRQFKDAGRPIWATEAGWLLDNPYDQGGFNWMKVSARQQADYLVGAFQYARDRYPWLQAMFVYNLDFSTVPWYARSDPSRWFSILAEDESPRPAYTALARWLNAAR